MMKKVLTSILIIAMLIMEIGIRTTNVIYADDDPVVKIGDDYYYVESHTDGDTSNPPVATSTVTTDGLFKTPGGDGRVWTDKSVSVADDNMSFDVKLSTVGQSYSSESSHIINKRADVLIIIDDSSSMSTNSDIIGPDGQASVRRYVALVNAVNKAIDIIMTEDPNNRVEVVLYGVKNDDSNYANERVLLPLASYQAGTDSNFKYIKYASDGDNYSLQRATGLKYADKGTLVGDKSISGVRGTLTQYNVYKSINNLIGEIDGKTADIRTIPYVFLFTDGEATTYATDFNCIVPTNTGSVTQHPTGELKTSIVASTILTIAYWKDQLSKKYRDYNSAFEDMLKSGESDVRFFSVGLSKSFREKDNAMLCPKLLLDKYDDSDGKWDSGSEVHTITKGDNHIELIIPDASQKKETMQEDSHPDAINEVVTELNRIADLDINESKLTNYKISKDSTPESKFIYTTDTFYYKTDSVAGLEEAFTDLSDQISEETQDIVIPIHEETSPELYGGVTIKDYIGNGMEVTKVSSITAKCGTKTYVMEKVSTAPTGVVERYAYQEGDSLLMYADITKEGTNEVLTWEVSASMLPLFIYNRTSRAYVDAKPITLTYNVSLTEASKNGLSSNKSPTFYSNTFVANSNQGTALGVYYPKEDNPHFYKIEEGQNKGTHPRFLEEDGTTPKTIDVNKIPEAGSDVSNITETATLAGVARFPVEVTVTEGGVTKIGKVMNNYLGNNGVVNFTPVEPIDVKVEKTWSDSNNVAGRPSSIDIQLYKTVNGTTSEAGDPVTIVPDPTTGAWSHTFTGLSPYEEIDSVVYPVTYSVRELDTSKTPAVPVDDGGKIGSYGVSYGTAENGTLTINNTELTSVPVQKIWKDDGTDSGRPAVTVQLYADGSPVEGKTEALSSSNSYACTFTDLPKYNASGNAIAYTVRELDTSKTPAVPVDDGGKAGSYLVSYAAADDGTLTITNTLVTSLPVTKTWVDGGNAGSTRPESIRVQLYRTANSETAKVGDPVEIAPDKTTGAWSHTFESLPAYVEIGTDIYPATYSAREVDAGGDPIADGVRSGSYVVSYDPGNGGAIANALVVDVPVEKIWDDAENQDGRRPEAVWVELYADGTAVSGSKQKLDSSNGFNHTYQSLPAYNGDAAIAYTVAELTGESGSAIADGGKYSDDYTVSYGTVDGAATLTITNKHVPDVTEVTVKKVWDDASNQDGKRPGSVVYKLYKEVDHVVTEVKAGDSPVTATLSETDPASDAWTYKFENLPVYENGKKITYTIKELDPSGAEIADNGKFNDDYDEVTYSSDHLSVTNKHIPEEITIQGTKTWSDADYIGKTGYSRPSITINVLDGETIVDTITVNAPDTDNGVWSWKSKDLPKRRNGSEIQYTVVEVVDGFESAVDNTNYSIVNTPKRDENDKETPVKLTVRKLVTGTEAGLNGATFTLIDADKNESDCTTAVDGTATIEFTKTGTYTLKEKSAPEGYDIDPNEYTIVIERSGLISIDLNENRTAWQWLYNLLFSEETKKIFDESTSTLTIHDRAIMDIPVYKIWDDLNDAARIRPAEISVSLYADGVLVESVMIDGELSADGILVLSKENSWKGTYEDLDRYTEDGEEIVYTIRETVPEKYTATYSGSAKEGFRVTNCFRPIPPVPYIPPVTGDR